MRIEQLKQIVLDLVGLYFIAWALRVKRSWLRFNKRLSGAAFKLPSNKHIYYNFSTHSNI